MSFTFMWVLLSSRLWNAVVSPRHHIYVYCIMSCLRLPYVEFCRASRTNSEKLHDVNCLYVGYVSASLAHVNMWCVHAIFEKKESLLSLLTFTTPRSPIAWPPIAWAVKFTWISEREYMWGVPSLSLIYIDLHISTLFWLQNAQYCFQLLFYSLLIRTPFL